VGNGSGFVAHPAPPYPFKGAKLVGVSSRAFGEEIKGRPRNGKKARVRDSHLPEIHFEMVQINLPLIE
jgi:hypothetical protein